MYDCEYDIFMVLKQEVQTIFRWKEHQKFKTPIFSVY